ncbi:MAG: hypothetical protein IT376_21505 [Polyangiaceae bacterium]|nr:hypothetical protein [Polyangiaceae bacterium]
MSSPADPDGRREAAWLDDAEELALAEALRAAWRPAELDSACVDELVELALTGPELASGEAAIEAEALRAAAYGGELSPARAGALAALAVGELPTPAETLAGRTLAHELGSGAPPPLVEALRAAWEPRELAAGRAAVLADRAVERRRRTNVIAVAFGAGAGVLALAAGVALLVRPPPEAAPAAAAVPVARSRSTAALFEERFTVEATSARIDRIGEARARDLRANRYAAWGVR